MMIKSSVISDLLRKAWKLWDSRIMVLLSLLLQAILLILGKRRKYTNSALYRNILWLAYLTADWVAIAALGKLSTASEVSAPSFTLRSLWAPLLLLHLGGADTITSYDFEDNQIWSRHLITLTLKSVLALYVIYLSWTKLLWISLLSIPLMVAGIIKYVERILCLRFSFSGRAGQALRLKDAYIPAGFYARLSHEVDTLVLAFHWFATARPDVNNYIPLLSASQRIRTYLGKHEKLTPEEVTFFVEALLNKVSDYKVDLNFLASIQLGFMFDVVHTKSAIIYTKLGGILRLLSFCGTFCVLVLFLERLTDVSNYHLSKVDIFVTSILLVGSVALELYAAWLIISSDWALLLMLKYGRSFPRVVEFFQNFRWKTHILNMLVKKKRWANSMGQLDLVNYCLSHRNWKEWNPLMFRVLDYFNRLSNAASYEKIPHQLMNQEFVAILEDYMTTTTHSISFSTSRGLQTFNAYECSHLDWTFQLDFDQSIIVWHIVTKVLYELDKGARDLCIQGGLEEQGQCLPQDEDKENMNLSKKISDYMMYLLALRPSMILPESSKNFWLDNTKDYLKEVFNVKLSHNNDILEAMNLLLQQGGDLRIRAGGEFRAKETSSKEETIKYALEVIDSIRDFDWKWEMLQSMWIEMLVNAAGGAFGGHRALRPVPPEKGVFPLDHMHECDLEKKDYLSCLKSSGHKSAKCRHFPRKYLECRMEKNLMVKQDMYELGFGKEANMEDGGEKINGKIEN